MSAVPELAEKIERLTPEQRRLIEMLIDILSRPAHLPQPPRLSWVGKARDLMPHLDSVQLQHEISKSRCE
ncbi:MAG: hypothetical protein NZL85_05960, partial [Fimbriimonadales bacterium]|nr:hypothetical protein [Fimbriimonadales bacterium]